MSRYHTLDLSSPYAEALDAAVDFILSRYDVWGLVAAGRIVTGNPDPTSDLDLYVIHGEPRRQRVQRTFAGIPTEIFVNPPATVRGYFKAEQNRPITAHMLATGVVLVNRHPAVDALIDEAHQWLATPPNLSATQLTLRIYMAVDLLDNARDIVARDPTTATLLLHDAVRSLIDIAFLAANRHLPRAKATLSALATLNPQLAKLATAFYTASDVATRLALATQIAAQLHPLPGFFEWESPWEDVPA